MTDHGGKRPGAGRKSGEPSKQVRVPLSLVPAVEALKRLKKAGPDQAEADPVAVAEVLYALHLAGVSDFRSTAELRKGAKALWREINRIEMSPSPDLDLAERLRAKADAWMGG
jgi:hypothetical protein